MGVLSVFYPETERRTRSLSRSVCWRILGILFLALVTYVITREWVTTTAITVVHHGTFILIYYLHERFWLRTNFLRGSKFKPFARIILYEIILGNLILGIISLIFTGSIQQMATITLIYITNKYWMYYAFDLLWGRLKWQTK